jgi:hypothetical protein
MSQERAVVLTLPRVASRAAARRELEDLRAAIGHHRSEGLCREIVSVVLPERGHPRERWLTRSEAARLIWAAWRYREVQKGTPTGRRRQHVARFVLVALYTGTRAGAVCSALFGPATHTGWIDLDRGVFHRRAPGERETNKRKPPVKLARGSSPTCAAGTRTASATPSSSTASPSARGWRRRSGERARTRGWRASRPTRFVIRPRRGSCGTARGSGKRLSSSA